MTQLLSSKRIFFIIIFVIFSVLTLISYDTFLNYKKYLSIKYDNQNITYLSMINNALSYINTEMIHGAIHIGNLGKGDSETLNNDRYKSDIAIQKIQTFIEEHYHKHKDFEQVKQSIKTLKKIRNQIDALSSDVLTTFKNFYYDDIADVLITMSLNKNKNLDNINLIQLFQTLNRLEVQLTLEDTMMLFFINQKRPLPQDALILWDRLIKEDQLPSFSKVKDFEVKEKLTILITDKRYKNLKKNIRTNVFYHILTGAYETNTKMWLRESIEKKVYIHKLKNSLFFQISSNISKHLKKVNDKLFNNLLWLIFVLIMLAIIIIARYSLNKNKQIVETALQNVEVEKAATKAKDQFLANMSHEIRTPLNGIIGFTQLLSNTTLNQEQKEFVSIIETSSESLLGIINDILDISKINAEKMEIEEIPFNLIEKIESVLEILSAKAEAKNIILSLYVEPSISPYRIGDPTRLAQVIMNLIGNAIKFTPDFGQISCIIEDTEDGKLLFKVKDTGIGISKENQTKIFQAFSQADTSTVRKFGGTGLGLTISSMIVKLMDGKLDLESSKGKGSIFFFTIPLERDYKQTRKALPTYIDTKVSFVVANKNVLQDNHLLMQNYLEKLGCHFSFIQYDEISMSTVRTHTSTLFIFNHFELNTHKNEIIRQTINSARINAVLITNNTLKKEFPLHEFKFNTTFTFIFNIDKIIKILNEHIINKVPKKEEDLSNKNIIFENVRILVAEDDIINQKLIKTVLANLNIDVTITNNGLEAYDAYKKESYDMFFTDIIMPKMDGLEVSKKIRSYEKNNNKTKTPIVALTGQRLETIKQEYLEAGIDDYMLKPLSLKELKKLLIKYFATHMKNM